MKTFSLCTGIAALCLTALAFYLGIAKLNTPKPIAIRTIPMRGEPGIPADPANSITASVRIPQHEVNQKVEILGR